MVKEDNRSQLPYAPEIKDVNILFFLKCPGSCPPLLYFWFYIAPAPNVTGYFWLTITVHYMIPSNNLPKSKWCRLHHCTQTPYWHASCTSVILATSRSSALSWSWQYRRTHIWRYLNATGMSLQFRHMYFIALQETQFCTDLNPQKWLLKKVAIIQLCQKGTLPDI